MIDNMLIFPTPAELEEKDDEIILRAMRQCSALAEAGCFMPYKMWEFEDNVIQVLWALRQAGFAIVKQKDGP